MQDMVALLSFRFEDEFSIDSFTEDLKDILSYPITLINEEALLFAKYLRNEKKDWIPRLPNLSVNTQ